jgi:hypothetical protein
VKFGKRMVYKKKKEIHEKYLKMPPGWILGTIKRELNLYASGNDTLEDLQDRTEMALAYWRQNRRQYPSPQVLGRALTYHKYEVVSHLTPYTDESHYSYDVITHPNHS